MKRADFCKLIAGVFGVCLMSYNAVAATIVISQVYYDPIGTESGGEAIELYNPNTFSVNLYGYTIKTESSEKDVLFGVNHIIAAKGYFLVTDFGWDSFKDNKSWVSADYEETMNMYNSDSGIALVNTNGTIIDAVGWGDANFIATGLYETEPALSVKSGEVLLRINNTDTDNNKNDFIVSAAEFHNRFSDGNKQVGNADNNIVNNNNSNLSNNDSAANNGSFINNENLSFGENHVEKINLQLVVNNSNPAIESIALDDDDQLIEGIQIQPEPNQNKTVGVHVMSSDANGADDLQSMTMLVITDHVEEITLVKNQTIDSTKAMFVGNFSLASMIAAKDYSVTFILHDKQNGQDQKTISFSYLSLVAFSFDSNQLVIPVTANQTVNISGDQDFSTTNKPTLKNIGNVPLQFGFASNGLTNNGNIIAVDSLQYKLGNLGLAHQFGNAVAVDEDTIVEPNDLTSFDLSFQLPAILSQGIYSGDITVYAVASD